MKAGSDTVAAPRKCFSVFIVRLQTWLHKDIWELKQHDHPKMLSRLHQLLRILTLTWQGLRRNQIPVQAAALTFYSLIGIGPLVAFSIMISGFLLDQDVTQTGEPTQDSVVVQAITHAITFAAPHVAVQVDNNGVVIQQNQLAPEMLELIHNFSAAAKSGTVGIIGSLMLLVIGLQVLSSIEKSFNTLWGVAQGRKLSERIVTYWTFISLGAVLGTAALTLISVNTFYRFAETLPLGSTLAALVQFCFPVIAFIVIALLIALFFRFIPNTPVHWKPAFVGALLVVSLLHIYKLLSFLYVQRVVDTKSLYGSVGIIIVLMLGLYIFWLLILLGAQLTYAVQNADYLTNENAWQRTSEQTREMISLAILMLIAKRFQHGHAPLFFSELYQALRVPSHILNAGIAQLSSMGYVYEVHAQNSDIEYDRAYQAGRPLNTLTLAEFKQTFDCYGNNEGSELIARTYPSIRIYTDALQAHAEVQLAQLKIEDLITTEPVQPIR